jgi:hypothetical protein
VIVREAAGDEVEHVTLARGSARLRHLSATRSTATITLLGDA